MRALWAMGMAVVAVAMGGCAAGFRAGSDGNLCMGSAGGSNKVRIEVGYAADGTPTVSPTNCVVRKNTHVTWVGPLDDTTEFTVDFGGPTPDDDGKIKFHSKHEDRNQRSRIKSKDANAGFKYTISANGKQLDPMIIIER